MGLHGPFYLLTIQKEKGKCIYSSNDVHHNSIILFNQNNDKNNKRKKRMEEGLITYCWKYPNIFTLIKAPLCVLCCNLNQSYQSLYINNIPIHKLNTTITNLPPPNP